MAVLSFPRLMGWRDPQILGQIFTQVGWLVGSVPVVMAKVPWGPPFAKDLTAKLIDAIHSVTALSRPPPATETARRSGRPAP